MKNLSIRIQNIAPSLTVAVDSLAKKLKAEGKDIVSLGAGEPDWDTPEEICEAAKYAIDETKTRYTIHSTARNFKRPRSGCKKIEK